MFAVRRKVTVAAVALAAALALAACGGTPSDSNSSTTQDSSGEQQLDRVSVALTAFNSLHIWAMVARDYQLMEPWDIDLDVVILDGTSKVVPSLLSGDVQFASATPEQAMGAHLQQPDLKMILSSVNANPYVVVAGEGMDELSDLEGKTIGVNGLGSSADYFGSKIVLSEAGLEENDDYTFVQSGNTAQRVAALEAGQVDAILVWEPDAARAEAVGGNVIYSLSDSPSFDGAQFSSFVALSSWYEEENDLAVRWVRGYQDTVRWMQDPANKDAIVESIAAQLQVDQDLAESTYQQFLVDMPAEDPVGTLSDPPLRLTLENAQDSGVENLLDIDPDDLSDFYDNSLNEAAQELEQ